MDSATRRQWIALAAALLAALLVALLAHFGHEDEHHLPLDADLARQLATKRRDALGPHVRVQTRSEGTPEPTGTTLERIVALVVRVHGIDASALTSATRLADPPLSFRSIDFDELVMDVEEHFGITLGDDDLGVRTGKNGTGPGSLTLGRIAAIVDAKLAGR